MSAVNDIINYNNKNVDINNIMKKIRQGHIGDSLAKHLWSYACLAHFIKQCHREHYMFLVTLG